MTIQHYTVATMQVHASRLGSMATSHFPGGPFGSQARWAATSTIQVGQMRSIVGKSLRPKLYPNC